MSKRKIIRLEKYDFREMVAPWKGDQIIGFKLDRRTYLVFPGDYHNDVPRVNVDGKNVKVPLRAYKLVQSPESDKVGVATCRVVNDTGLLRRLGVKIEAEQQALQ